MAKKYMNLRRAYPDYKGRTFLLPPMGEDLREVYIQIMTEIGRFWRAVEMTMAAERIDDPVRVIMDWRIPLVTPQVRP